jgi:hypothetical protein
MSRSAGSAANYVRVINATSGKQMLSEGLLITADSFERSVLCPQQLISGAINGKAPESS